MPSEFPKHCMLCGGCNIATASKEEVLERKLLIAKSQYKISEIWHSDSQAYRARAYFRARLKGGVAGLKLGFFKKNSREFLEIDYCPILMPPLNDFITHCRNLDYNHSDLEVKFKVMVDVLRNRDNTYALNVEISGYKEDREALEVVRDYMQDFSLTSSVRIRGESAGSVAVKDYYQDLNFYHSPGDFSQAQFRLNDRIRSDLLETAKGLSVVSLTELFSGNGNFSLPLSKSLGCQIRGFELSQSAVNAALRSVAENKLDAHYEVANLYSAQIWKNIKFDERFVLVDPPRNGLGEIASMISSKYIYYISCSFQSLNYDYIERLKPNGYRVKSLKAADMMPFTDHVEYVALLEKTADPI